MNMGRKDVAVTTVDLSKDSGLMIAQGSTLKGSGAQHPYHQGVSEAMIALYALIGKEAPTYVAVPGSVVVKENIVCSMEGVFNEPPSKDLVDAAGPQSDVTVPTDLPTPPPATAPAETAPAAAPTAAS
jgi:ribose transport system substrate-binding protein